MCFRAKSPGKKLSTPRKKKKVRQITGQVTCCRVVLQYTGESKLYGEETLHGKKQTTGEKEESATRKEQATRQTKLRGKGANETSSTGSRLIAATPTDFAAKIRLLPLYVTHGSQQLYTSSTSTAFFRLRHHRGLLPLPLLSQLCPPPCSFFCPVRFTAGSGSSPKRAGPSTRISTRPPATLASPLPLPLPPLAIPLSGARPKSTFR